MTDEFDGVIVSAPKLLDVMEGEEDAIVSVAEYLAMWGCDPCYDRYPNNRGDGYIFYNYGPEVADCDEKCIPYLKDQLLPALARQLKNQTLTPLQRKNFEQIVAYVKERLTKEFGV